MAGTRSLAVQQRDAAMTEAMNAVVELRRRRPQPSFRTIADTLGLSPETARRYYYEALTITNEYSAQLADAERAEQLHITDRLLDRILPLVTEPRLTKDGTDLGPSLEATDRVIRILERRARVTGSDMPTKVAQTDPSGQHEYHAKSDEALLDELRTYYDRAQSTALAAGGALSVDPAGASEPIAADWDVVHLDAPGGPRLREDADGSGMGPPQG